MKNLFLLLSLCLVNTVYAQGFAPTPEASQACQTVQPTGAWRECVENYQRQQEALKADPKYEEELRFKQRLLELQEQQNRILQQPRTQTCYPSGGTLICN